MADAINDYMCRVFFNSIRLWLSGNSCLPHKTDKAKNIWRYDIVLVASSADQWAVNGRGTFRESKEPLIRFKRQTMGHEICGKSLIVVIEMVNSGSI